MTVMDLTSELWLVLGVLGVLVGFALGRTRAKRHRRERRGKPVQGYLSGDMSCGPLPESPAVLVRRIMDGEDKAMLAATGDQPQVEVYPEGVPLHEFVERWREVKKDE